jgi:hypothetical protein
MLLNEGTHGFGNEIADGAPLRNPQANLGGGDIDPARNPKELMCGRVIAALENDEADELLQVFDPTPGMKLPDVVLTDEVKELGVGMIATNQLNGVDGKTWSSAFDFRVVDRKRVFIRKRSVSQLKANLRIGWDGLEFVRGKESGDKNDVIERELIGGLASEDQMPVMNGIEGSAVKTETHDRTGQILRVIRGELVAEEACGSGTRHFDVRPSA